jgi:hypothetical protein
MTKYLNYIIALVTILSFIVLFDYDILSAFAVSIFVYWLSSLIIRSNDSLPLKELFLSLYSLQFLFGSALAYNGMDAYNPDGYTMKINSDDYFIYIIPVFLSFSLGFNYYVKKNSIRINRVQIDNWLKEHKVAPYYFIGIGFVASFISSVIPESLSFVAYLFESFKFIGLFILLISYQRVKPLLMALIYGLILISSFQGGMFHDLLTWTIILALILSLRYKPNLGLKITGLVFFGIFAIFIQSIKSGLREQTWFGNKQVSFELIQNINSNNERVGGILNIKNLGPQLIRINQGWVLASTMDNVPKFVNYTYGLLTIEYLYSALVPRIFDPDKLNAGSQEVFNRYSGHYIDVGTSIALGLFTDAYIEFGQFGAIIYVFIFGLMYGYILNQFNFNSKKFPILILFATLAFIYPMRPDSETQTALGHLFKTIMLLWFIFRFFNKFFRTPIIIKPNL